MIGPRTGIKGDLSGGDPVDIAGVLEGHSSVTGLYRVRQGARVVGNVTATSIVIEGELSGEKLVGEKVEIGASARVHANVRARLVAIAEGAFFDGQVHMEGRDAPIAPMAFTEKRKDRRPDGQDSSRLADVPESAVADDPRS